MPERRYKVPLLGRDTDVTEVPIQSMSEKVSTYELEDGATLAVRAVVTAVLRVEGQYDNDGNPVYLLKNNIVVTPTSVPDNLRKAQ